jgi:hypothetical protein
MENVLLVAETEPSTVEILIRQIVDFGAVGFQR